MKWIFRIIAGLVALLLVVGFAAPMFLNGEWLKEQVETEASKALGRDVRLSSAPTVSILPSAKLNVKGLTVANADGFSAPHFISVYEARLGVKLLPLLSKRVSLTEFTLSAPDIHLQTRTDGEVNWLLGAPGEAQAPTSNDGSLPVADLSLGNVIIRDGTIEYDDGAGTVYRAENADVTLSLESLSKPLTLKGTMDVQGEAATVDMTLTTPRAFLENEPADLFLNTNVGKNTVRTTLSLANPLSFDGDLDVDVPALRALIALTGTTIDTPDGFESVRLKGLVRGDADTFAFGEGTEIGFDAIDGTGGITIELSGARPKISGSLTTNSLDLRPYLPASEAGPAPGTSFPAWSEEEMDFAALREIDLDLTLAVGEAILPMTTIGTSEIDLDATAGRVTATLNKSELFGGTGTGSVAIDARNASRVTLVPDLTLTNIDIAKLSTDLAGVDRLLGKGNVRIDLSTTGLSQRDWVDNVQGTFRVDLDDGTLKGINLGKIARGAYETYTSVRDGGFNLETLKSAAGQLTASAQGPAEETDFSDLAVDLNLASGQAISRRFDLTGPYFAINGDIDVNLSAQSIRMTLTPSASAIEGEGLVQLPIPILVSGTFSDPKIGLDTAPLLRQSATRGLTDILGRTGIEVPEDAGGVEDVLRGAASNELGKLLGRNQDTDAGDENDSAQSAGDELLKLGVGALFGGNDDDDDKKTSSPE